MKQITRFGFSFLSLLGMMACAGESTFPADQISVDDKDSKADEPMQRYDSGIDAESDIPSNECEEWCNVREPKEEYSAWCPLIWPRGETEPTCVEACEEKKTEHNLRELKECVENDPLCYRTFDDCVERQGRVSLCDQWCAAREEVHQNDGFCDVQFGNQEYRDCVTSCSFALVERTAVTWAARSRICGERQTGVVVENAVGKSTFIRFGFPEKRPESGKKFSRVNRVGE